MGAGAHAVVETPRLRLAPVTAADPEDVAAAIGNYDVARWLGRVPYPYGAGEARAFITANADRAGRVWFIYDADGLVGGISIDGELGYWLARTAWGQGYATEAGDAAIDVHFADPAQGDLTSGHYPGNDRSAGVLRKLGFRYTGTTVVQARALAQPIESHAMVLPRADWQARREILIETPRLRLRPLVEGDWRRLQRIGGVPEVARMMAALTVPWPETEVKRWIAASRFRGRKGFRLGVEAAGGHLIGAVGLGPDASVAYMLDRRFWGRGYATEALGAFLADIFRRFPEIETVTADHFADNPASARVMAKLGFERIGTGLGASRARPERAPNVLCRLRRTTFCGVA